MAGMLAGVECARRRRFHQSGLNFESNNSNLQGWTRRSSFCLYTSNHEKSHHLTSTSFMNQRGMLTHQDDHKLGVEAREAKERLDERLRSRQRKPEQKKNTVKSHNGVGTKGDQKVALVPKETIKNNNNNNSNNNINCNSSNNNNNGLSKKSNSGGGSRRFMKWTKLSFKACDQEECTICLEGLKKGDTLIHLPCAHRFHSTCLMPWLETNSHCPCCRLGIVS